MDSALAVGTDTCPELRADQSEHDRAYAKRAIARWDDPDEIARRIAEYRSHDKHRVCLDICEPRSA
jgi:hypothetical protein